MEQQKKFYIDMHQSDVPVQVDDFLVAVGKKQSNSVYHVSEVISRRPTKKRSYVIRHTIRCFKSDLMTALKRDDDQKLIPIQWYSRNKNQKK